MSAFNDPRLLKLERERREGPACQSCGYSLAGLPAGAPCPECGTPPPTPRERSRAKVSKTQGLMRTTPVEQLRFGVGFFGLSAVAAIVPLLEAIGFFTPLSTEIVSLWLAAAWWAALALLMLKRFAIGHGEARFTTEAPTALIAATLATQWLWFAAAAMHALNLTPAPWAALIPLGIAALGLFPTMWCIGDLLEWGGDEVTGRDTKWMLLIPIYVAAFATLLSLVLYLLMPRIPGVLTLMGRGALGITCIYVYARIVWGLYGGVSMALWARRIQQNNETRTERIDAHRADVEAQQAARIARNERIAMSMHAKKDTPVGLDDFDA